jgi:hypothetical protein
MCWCQSVSDIDMCQTLNIHSIRSVSSLDMLTLDIICLIPLINVTYVVLMVHIELEGVPVTTPKNVVTFDHFHFLKLLHVFICWYRV